MTVRVARSTDDLSGRGHVILTASYPTSALTHETEVGPGVRIGADLMAPNRWHTVSVAGKTSTNPVVRTLLGGAVAHLDEVVPATDSSLDPGARVAAPWLRIAVVDSLDRWLNLPLNQALVDAERGVCRGQAAKSLPSGEARDMVMGDALRLARRASTGVTHYLRGLVAGPHPISTGLFRSMKRLMIGYAELAAEVRDPDRQLAATLASWQALSSGRMHVLREAALQCSTPTSGAEPAHTAAPVAARLGSLIDPRQAPARVFALADPDSPEIRLSETRTTGGDRAVRIRVPAFPGPVDPDVQRRLLVRLVDRRTADLVGQALLTATDPEPGRQHYAFYHSTVPMAGWDVDALRADVFDALSEIPVVSADTAKDLQDVRRAAVFLSEWRRVVALARLPSVAAAPARRVLELAKRIQSNELEVRSGRALFECGPSAAELVRLAGLGDERLLRCVRGAHRPARSGLPGLTDDAGELLVAELAAVHAAEAA